MMNQKLQKTISAYNESAEAYVDTIAKLPNYDITYDYFIDQLRANDSILDLACGPANISKRIYTKYNSVRITGVDLSESMISIAKSNLPDAVFHTENIINYRASNPQNAVILGFALPYLNSDEVDTIIKNTALNLTDNGKFYISFMHGDAEGFEKPSFNTKVELYIYYHNKMTIQSILAEYNLRPLKTWELDYTEADGQITKDIIIVGEKHLIDR